MNHRFLPAVGPYITDSSREWRYPIHPFDPAIKEIFYPEALGSYALWYKDKKGFPFPSNVGYFGDSGGYTYVTDPDYSASPTDVIRWQMRWCKKGVIFDCPPYRPGSAIQFTGSAAEWFDESVVLTRQNVQRALPLYIEHKNSGGQFRLWGVIQGEEWEQMERWHGTIASIYPFADEGEGWALAPKPSTDLLSCTRYLRFAHEKRIPNVHLLQVTADRVVGLVLSLAKLAGTFDLVTYDSASALRCAINRSAIISDGGFGQRYIKESRTTQVDEKCGVCSQLGTECLCPGNENTVHEMMMQCSCFACQKYREFYPHSNAEYPHLILLHNHLIMVESFRLMWEEVQRDADRVLRWATDKQYGDVLREWERVHSAPKVQRRSMSLIDRIMR